MLRFDEQTRIWLILGRTDMRKAINGLSDIVANQLKLAALSGQYFVFCGRQRNTLKILYWDNNGYGLWLLCESSHNIHRQNPFRSQYNAFTVFPRLFKNKNRLPENGFCVMALSDKTERLLMPCRPSVRPNRKKIFVPLGSGIIGAPLRRPTPRRPTTEPA